MIFNFLHSSSLGLGQPLHATPALDPLELMCADLYVGRGQTDNLVMKHAQVNSRYVFMPQSFLVRFMECRFQRKPLFVNEQQRRVEPVAGF